METPESKKKNSESNKAYWESLSEEEYKTKCEHLKAISANMKGKERSEEYKKQCSERMRKPERIAVTKEMNSKRKKYTEETILKVVEEAGVKIEGDLSCSDNIVTITWPTGEIRRLGIKKFMKYGLKRPTNKKTLIAEAKMTEIGLEVICRKGKEATLRYKNQEWTQSWAGCPNQTTKKYIKNIDMAESIADMVADGSKPGTIAKALNIDPTTLRRYLRLSKQGEIHQFTKQNYEQTLSYLGAIYNRQLPGYSIRPDIRFENPKVIIEIDGMCWHTEEQKSKGYHFDRALLYRNEGYRFLAFSQYEIENKRPIVDSMINNALGKSHTLGARKCTVEEIPSSESRVFFEANHLHGAGSGKTFALKNNGEIVAAIRWIPSKEGIFISRFCNKINLTIVGAYSRLLSKLPQGFDIINFVDARHGDGSGLLKLGFELIHSHIGFEWTDGYNHYNRRTFLGNSGYDHGFLKFYDYGQYKFVLKNKAGIEPALSHQG